MKEESRDNLKKAKKDSPRKNRINHKSQSNPNIFSILLLTCYIIIVTNYAYSLQAQQQLQNNDSYTEIFLGDQQLPFTLLGREILSSSDVSECSVNQAIHSTLQGVIENGLEQASGNTLTTNNDGLEQQSTTRPFHNLLLGFPFTALNKPLLIGTSVTNFSDQNNAHYQTKHYQDIFREYQFSFLDAKEVQAHLTNSDGDGCFLNLVFCGSRGNCEDEDGQTVFYTRIPVLGISQKHQAVIVDPALLGHHLSDKIAFFSPNTPPPQRLNRRETLIPTKDHLAFVVDFSQSTLIFDVTSTLDWETPLPLPEMTSRWFIKLGADQDNFMNKPPHQGIEYFLVVYSFLQNGPLILTGDISRDRPMKYYVKDVPSEYHEAVRKGFEHWNSISIALMGYPVFSYVFIQGDYDGQQEIITRDIRYNVLEWDFQDKYYPYNGITFSFFDQNIGKILSTNIFLQGPRLIEKHSRWFRYSEMIRANEVVRDTTLPTDALENDNLISVVSLPNLAPHLQVLTLAPQTETFESYIQGFITTLVAHELGHSLGLAHHSKGNIFAQGEYASHSAMDVLSFHTNYKPFSQDYDRKALAYGYLDILPSHIDTSCNMYNPSNDQGPSPECSMNDETAFPLENFAIRLREVFDLLMNRRDDQSLPYLIWNSQVHNYFSGLTSGLLAYYSSADTYYDNLQSVFIDGRKPENPQEVKDLVMSYLYPMACDPNLNHLLKEYIIRNPNDSIFDEALQFNASAFLNNLQNQIFSRTDLRMIACSLNL